ncbi:hypothetical protein G3O00_20725 [Burkholderia sp. Ac-20384]|uniref:hypothetical protein n=1 Tax=Burkholderia sp. Ac-20384 TaxID=2703902 RepID=UPI00197F5114|nr:hypothetical protein [Burkholderia sp. Ac-20384]MBN3826035.1 hypothetical protein [Burkholderia sp. Ac-20384]
MDKAATREAVIDSLAGECPAAERRARRSITYMKARLRVRFTEPPPMSILASRLQLRDTDRARPETLQAIAARLPLSRPAYRASTTPTHAMRAAPEEALAAGVRRLLDKCRCSLHRGTPTNPLMREPSLSRELDGSSR